MSLLAVLLSLIAGSNPPYASATYLKEPVPFAEGTISTADFESHPHFSGDGKTLFFVKSTPQFTDWKIFVSAYVDGTWSKPTMAPFSGKYRDADPFITSDGRRMYFISDRPAPGKAGTDMDIWYMEAAKGGWGEPKHLGPEVNTPGDEWFPTVTKDGRLFFGSPRKGGLGGCDIWTCTPKGKGFNEAENLGATINTASDEVEPYVTPDGKTLIFNSDRRESLGGLDFFVSTWSKSGWSTPRHLATPFNSKTTELSPKITPDGRYFMYTKIRGKQRLGDIMMVEAKEILK